MFLRVVPDPTANVLTPNYQRKEVAFESQLSEIIEREDLKDYIKIGTDDRIYAVAEMLRRDVSEEEIYVLSGIDPFFTRGLKKIIKMESEISDKQETSDVSGFVVAVGKNDNGQKLKLTNSNISSSSPSFS